MTCYFDNYPGCGQDAGPCDKMIFWHKAITDYCALISHPLSPEPVSHVTWPRAGPTCLYCCYCVMMSWCCLQSLWSWPGPRVWWQRMQWVSVAGKYQLCRPRLWHADMQPSPPCPGTAPRRWGRSTSSPWWPPGSSSSSPRWRPS